MRSMRRMAVWIGAVALLGGALVTVAAPATAAAKPQTGGTLTILKASEAPNGWDPVNVGAIPQNTPTPQQLMIFDLLVYEDPVTLKIVPRVAQSFTTSDNGTTWTLKLRPNIQFSDGTPYDAAAVQFNWQREADATRNPRPTGYGTASAIATMDVVDPLTLKITLKAQDTAW